VTNPINSLKIHGITSNQDKKHHKLSPPSSKFLLIPKLNTNLIKIVDCSNLIESYSVQFITQLTMDLFQWLIVMIKIHLIFSSFVVLKYSHFVSSKLKLLELWEWLMVDKKMIRLFQLLIMICLLIILMIFLKCLNIFFYKSKAFLRITRNCRKRRLLFLNLVINRKLMILLIELSIYIRKHLLINEKLKQKKRKCKMILM